MALNDWVPERCGLLTFDPLYLILSTDTNLKKRLYCGTPTWLLEKTVYWYSFCSEYFVGFPAKSCGAGDFFTESFLIYQCKTFRTLWLFYFCCFWFSFVVSRSWDFFHHGQHQHKILQSVSLCLFFLLSRFSISFVFVSLFLFLVPGAEPMDCPW